MAKNTTGSCLCRRVTYEVIGELREIMLCHCSQCRKTSGHYVAATSCPTNKLIVAGENALSWFQSSDNAKRAFCSTCGSNLFWRPGDGKSTSIFAGTIDGDTGLRTVNQLYPENKGDYYDLPNVTVIDQNPIK